jgi:phosphoribosylformylglycinamidine synthase PurS subunit
MRARVLVTPKAGILDPQGQAVERALPALGFSGVRNVHVGRLIELDVEDPARLPEMCERLLTNPLIEDYVVESVAMAEAAEIAGSDSAVGSSAGAELPAPTGDSLALDG